MSLYLYRVQADCTWDDAVMAAYYMATSPADAIAQYQHDLATEDEIITFDDWKFSTERVPSPDTNTRGHVWMQE